MRDRSIWTEEKSKVNTRVCKGIENLRIADPRHMGSNIEQTKDLKNSNSVYEEDNTLDTKKSAIEPLSRDVSETQNMTWEMFGLKPEVVKKIDVMGYAFPSPVQVKSIPHALYGRCLLVRSKNGTGKTASYVIPILNNVDVLDKDVQAIVVVPIRELALQVARNFRKMCEGLGILSVPVVGGMSMQDDIIRMLNGAHVMIGTPGRIVDLIEKKVGTLSKKVMLVFDEADKLLDISFAKIIARLLELMPQNRQIMLYSATFPYFIAGFMKKYMHSPLCINLMTELVPIGIKQFYVHVKLMDKLVCLNSLLTKTSGINQCVVFCNGIKTVELLAMKITEMGIPSYFMHSKMTQEHRNAVFHNFLKEKCKILVATDLITRGVDAPSTNYVINFDLPKTSESYLHRIGRAGRFGRAGVAISLVSEFDKEVLAEIEANVGNTISPLSDSGLTRL
ncbi:putative ATP-dependent RNA helicase ddx6 [Ordospora colligata]